MNSSVFTFCDSKCKAGETYTYTVVPYRKSGDSYVWGAFDSKGIPGKALLNAPHLLSLEGSSNGKLKLTWEKVKGADGYEVYRKLPGKTWILLGDAGDTDCYYDSTMMANLPYLYTVKSYTLEDDSKTVGSYDTDGLLWLPRLTFPEVSVNVENGAATLSWEPAEGMTGYHIYRRTEDTD